MDLVCVRYRYGREYHKFDLIMREREKIKTFTIVQSGVSPDLLQMLLPFVLIMKINHHRPHLILWAKGHVLIIQARSTLATKGRAGRSNRIGKQGYMYGLILRMTMTRGEWLHVGCISD